jgi:hypothetical protein
MECTLCSINKLPMISPCIQEMESAQVMAYRWPTEQSTNLNSYDDEWMPMEYPIIPVEKNIPIQSVAGSRKFNVLPFESDGFTSAVNAQRAGAGAPGLCGLGLTRDRSKFSNEFSSPLSTHNGTNVALQEEQEAAKLQHQSSTSSLDDEEYMKNSMAGMMFKAAGAQILSGAVKEEEGWRNIFRSCLPDGSIDPFESESRQSPSISGSILCDKICATGEESDAMNEVVSSCVSCSQAMRALRSQPPLQDALVAINDGFLTANEWIHFCEALRDIVKWNDFTS